MPIVRQYTDRLYEMVEGGILDKDTVITALLKYMSEGDVKDMMLANDFIEDESEDEDAEDE